ncbi:uncharacterized protein METZ01_LOCUS492745 [marine metagenome]|uniref:Uncharacterized protein n=1 Tax=marine metagenome TaxID=408172 RepID=A0A383D678_9ZZZZ
MKVFSIFVAFNLFRQTRIISDNSAIFFCLIVLTQLHKTGTYV